MTATPDTFGRADRPGDVDYRGLIALWCEDHQGAPITDFLTWMAANIQQDPFDILEDDEVAALLLQAGIDQSAASGIIEGWGVWP